MNRKLDTLMLSKTGRGGSFYTCTFFTIVMVHKLQAPQKLFNVVFTSELFTCSVVEHVRLEIMFITVLV